VFELQLSYDGDAWPSVSKGTGHICEDLVILPREGDAVPLILLADGATLAHGLTAIQIVRRVYDRWIEGFRKLVVSRYEDEIKSLIQQIHEELSREEQRCETTLVIMAVVTDPHEPRIMLTRFGNSGYLATFPREDGGGARFLAKSSSKQETKMLGAYEFEFQPWEDFEKIPLGEPGIYRLRAFSDGLTSKLSNAEEFLGLHKNFDIEDLTKEAADWAAQKILEVGTDDWSIAGFDIVVTKNPVAPPTDETITTIAAGSKAKDTVEYLSLIDPKKFQFSKEARTFWRNTLQQDALCHLAGYPMIQEVIGPAHIDDVPANQRRENQRRWQMATVVAAICILAVVWVWYGRSSDQESSTDTAGLTQPTRTNNTTPNPSSNQALTFSSPEANTIYQQLKTVGSSDLGRLPSGSTIEDKRLKDYLDGLAEVLGKTRWRVLIKVYTDKQGTDEDNRRTAELRATAIEGRLLKTERVAKAQIQMENVGESSSLVSDERTEEDRANNRRIVVTIRNTY
jgi:outer membrane protein OmpA-like peptidoglycan-associated protein/serine/threonine protein phosphatase PrpC